MWNILQQSARKGKATLVIKIPVLGVLQTPLPSKYELISYIKQQEQPTSQSPSQSTLFQQTERTLHRSISNLHPQAWQNATSYEILK